MTSTPSASALSSDSLLCPGRIELDRDLHAIITSLSEKERSTKSMLFPEITDLNQDLCTILASIQDPKGKIVTPGRRPTLLMRALNKRNSVGNQHLKYHFDPDEQQAINIHINGQIPPNTKFTLR